MARRVILAHDLGTTGDKAVAVDVERGVLAMAFRSYNTTGVSASEAEQDPREWWAAVCATSRQVLATGRFRRDEIAGVVLSGQMMGCLPVDGRGRPLRTAIIWADQRAVSQAGRLVEKLGLDTVYEITGHRVGPAYSGPKMAWLKENQPHLYRKTYKFLQAKDFIVHRLTNAWVTDYSDAGGTGLLDLRRRQWAETVVRALGLEEGKLPLVGPSTAVAGGVSRAANRATGVPVGTPVVVGGGDGVCATAGAGVGKEGLGYVYLGSSAWISTVAREPSRDQRKRTFTWIHLDPQWYSPNGTMHNAGSAVEWVRGLFRSRDYRVFEAQVAKCAPGAEGLVFLPHLRGERSPFWNPNCRGAFVGLVPGHSRAHLIRAVLEGVAFNLRAIAEALEEIGVKVERLRAIGGGAQSQVWRQVLSDVLVRPVDLVQYPLEATALGAAAAAAAGLGLAESVARAAEKLVVVSETSVPSAASETYALGYRRFCCAYEALSPLWAPFPTGGARVSPHTEGEE